VGFEPTIPVFEQTKKIHASDSGATVIARYIYYKKVLSETKLSTEIAEPISEELFSNKNRVERLQQFVGLDVLTTTQPVLNVCYFCSR
jgi:hypothetical protein